MHALDMNWTFGFRVIKIEIGFQVSFVCVRVCEDVCMRVCVSVFEIVCLFVCLDTCCSRFLTIIAGVHLHFSHESELHVCWTKGRREGGTLCLHY